MIFQKEVIMNIGIFSDTYFPQLNGVATSIRTKKGSGLPASLGVNYFREDR